MSDKKSRQIIRRAKHINKDALLVVVGCYAQVAKEELEKIEEIDVILDNTEKKDILKYVEEYMQKKVEVEYDIERSRCFAICRIRQDTCYDKNTRWM